MKIYIEVAEWFKRYTGGSKSIEVDIKESVSALQAVISCGIPEEEIGFISILKEDDKSVVLREEYFPKEGDTLKVFPQIIGG